MGRLKRIAREILRELNYKHPKAISVPALPTDQSLADHLALVTGGSSGIGLEIAKRLSACGCWVVISGTNEEKLINAQRVIGSPHVKTLALDVTQIECLESKIESAASLFPQAKGIDILVNSAGVHQHKPCGSVDEVTFDKVLDSNLKGTFFMSQAAANHMISRKIKGHILNVSSSSALRNARDPYAISKWGIKGMTLGFAEELIKQGIIVNAIGPGPTATPLLGFDPEGSLQHVPNPSRRMAHPGEVANLAVLLVSGYCDLVVGDTLYISGGAGTVCIDR